MSPTLNDIVLAAEQHAKQMSDDIRLASTRLEHVRLTARANEAALLASQLRELQTFNEAGQPT